MKCYEILRRCWTYLTIDACKNSNQNSISRSHFFFFWMFSFFPSLKIHNKLNPWRKILKIWDYQAMMVISMCTKNQNKIQFLGHEKASMYPQKKSIRSYKLGKCI